MMKTIKIYFYSFILLLLLVGCNSDDKNITHEEGQDQVEVNVADNGSDDVVNNPEDPVDNTEDSIGQEDVNIDEPEGEGIEEVTPEDEEGQISEGGSTTISYEGEILDLTAPEDEQEYTSGLVIIKKEQDYWRAVDRQGYVYRISTSAQLKPGMVIKDNNVSIDDEGERFVELTSSYVSYEDSLIHQKSADKAGKAVGDTLFMQYDLGKSLDSIKVLETIGSGIKRYTMDVTLENGEKTTFQYTLYGYEDTWIMPSASHINMNGKVDNTNEATDENNSEATEATDDASAYESEGIRREGLYDNDNVTYYQEHELLPQSNLTQGTDVYEYMTNIYSEDGSGKRQLIHKGGRNSYYETLVQFGQRVYLKANGWEPFSEEFSAGIGFLDLSDNTYKVLYNGPIIEGSLREDTFYFFADDKLLELSLGTGKYDSVTTLPESINDTILKIIAVDDATMRISLESDAVREYEINLSESTISEYTE